MKISGRNQLMETSLVNNSFIDNYSKTHHTQVRLG